jgi:hypothetical protein
MAADEGIRSQTRGGSESGTLIAASSSVLSEKVPHGRKPPEVTVRKVPSVNFLPLSSACSRTFRSPNDDRADKGLLNKRILLLL